VRDRIQERESPKVETKAPLTSKQSNTRRMSFARKPVPEAMIIKPVALFSESPELSKSLPVVVPVSDPPAVEPVKPASTWELDSPTLGVHYGVGSPTFFSLSSNTSPREDSRDPSPSTRPDGPISREIRHQREVVKFRVAANEEFLEKRRRSKINFHNELRKSSSSEERSANDRVVSDGSSFSLSAYDGAMSPVSPIMGRESRTSANGYDVLMTRQRSQGQASGTSRNSSLVQGSLHRADSQASEDSLFGLRAVSPMTPPPASAHRRTLTGSLATTLQLPGFGKGVEPGLEAVIGVDHENGLMLAHEGQIVHLDTPPASVVSIDHQMRHDSSFYKMGGFCEGAKMLLKGEVSYKQMKRPAGNFSSIVTAKCLKCNFEASWNAIEQDLKLDRTFSISITHNAVKTNPLIQFVAAGKGIYISSKIRYRQRFLSKCHVKTSSHEDPLFACIFCIEERRTIEPHDATIFFSSAALFRHLAKHPQPLPQIATLDVLYGDQPIDIVDFDIHFTVGETKTTKFTMAEIAAEVSSKPSAYAIVSNHYKSGHPKARDPNGNPILHFAAGARIVGVSFPEQFNGQWCMGFHDGDRGAFPASSITLDLPGREDVLMNAKSTLVAWAKWDFKPKDMKEGGWISFKKGDRISCVGYAFQDQWCWSGQTSKGKWGLFPSAFMDELRVDDGSNAAPVSRGLGARIASIPLGRKKTARPPARSGSLVTNGSSDSNGGRNGQPGLEVMSSFTGVSGNWK